MLILPNPINPSPESRDILDLTPLPPLLKGEGGCFRPHPPAPSP